MRIVKQLPDPFLMNNGSRVRNIEDWNMHRKYIKEMMLNIQYGTIPDSPEDVKVEILQTAEEEGEIFYQKVRLTFIPKKNRPEISFGMDAHIRYPYPDSLEDVKKEIPNFGMNGLPTLIYVGNNPLFQLGEAGFIVIAFENNQLDPMEMGNPIIGPAQKAYEELEPGKYSWGSIAVWAWGAIQLLNYALTLPLVNKDQIMISGHSRNGKTALLAGALDERFALVNPAGSGCAGAGSYLVKGEGCETLASLTDRRRWWAWTKKDFEDYAYEETNDCKKKLPFDQHFLMGLIAPRPLLRTEGDVDYWANPEGTCATFLATEIIYDFLGVKDKNQLAIRPGGHSQNGTDLEALVSFAYWNFFGIPQERTFKDNLLDSSIIPQLFDWNKPETNLKI